LLFSCETSGFLNREKVMEWDRYNEKDVICKSIQFNAKVLTIQNVIEFFELLGKQKVIRICSRDRLYKIGVSDISITDF